MIYNPYDVAINGDIDESKFLFAEYVTKKPNINNNNWELHVNISTNFPDLKAPSINLKGWIKIVNNDIIKIDPVIGPVIKHAITSNIPIINRSIGIIKNDTNINNKVLKNFIIPSIKFSELLLL